MRVYNFCAGPAALPAEVLAQAAAEMQNFQGCGMSVMEMSHRSKTIIDITETAIADLRELLNIGDDYAVLFMQGGASLQFSAVPLNLLGNNTTADYVNTGQWSKKAIQEAARYATVNVVASSEATQFTTIPPFDSWQLNSNAAYLHYTPNETIGGLEFNWVPDVNVPLVADMSSIILSRPVDVSRFGVIYAGAQKNIGPAGLTVVIIRRDLLGNSQPATPSLLNYQTAAASGSMYNTPPVYSIYLAGLVFKWLQARGGLSVMAAINQRKAEKLYAAIDSNDFYSNPVAAPSRSLMNVPFILANSSLDKTFLAESQAAGLTNLAGHRSVGGMRASIYNAMPESGVEALINFMQEFARKYG